MTKDEAIKKLQAVKFYMISGDLIRDTAEMAEAFDMAIEALKQPEVIRCKDCKHRGEKPIADGRYWCELHDTFMYYCSDAERRTDE